MDESYHLALALGLQACGGAGDAGSEAGERDVSAPAGATVQADSSPDAGSGAFCEQLGQQLTAIGELSKAAVQQDSARMQSLADQIRTTNEQLVDSVPPEVSDDVQVVVTATSELTDAVRAGNTNPAGLVQPLTSSEFQTASANLREYARDKCDLNVGGA